MQRQRLVVGLIAVGAVVIAAIVVAVVAVLGGDDSASTGVGPGNAAERPAVDVHSKQALDSQVEQSAYSTYDRDKVRKVSCPDDAPRTTVGATFTCTVEVAGEDDQTIKVTVVPGGFRLALKVIRPSIPGIPN